MDQGHVVANFPNVIVSLNINFGSCSSHTVALEKFHVPRGTVDVGSHLRSLAPFPQSFERKQQCVASLSDKIIQLFKIYHLACQIAYFMQGNFHFILLQYRFLWLKCGQEKI